LSKEDIVEHMDYFKYSKYCLISTEISISTCLAAASIAKENNLQVIVKPSALNSIPDELYRLTDIIIPNQKEALTLCPLDLSVYEQADYFLKKGVKAVIITMGKDGFLYKTPENMKEYSAVNFKTVDATGGADAFISALISYLSFGKNIDAALQIAAYAAAFCVTKHGVIPALVDRDSLEQYIHNDKPSLL
jgi:ribokinase